MEISKNKEELKNKTNEELYEFSWYNKLTLGEMIQLNTTLPFKNA